MLGLVVGVTSVVLLAACGQGVSNSVDARIETIANNITIVPQASDLPGGPPARNLTDADAAALQNAPDVATVTPAATATAIDRDQCHHAAVVDHHRHQRHLGPDQQPGLYKRGRSSTRPKYSSAARVVVLGPTVATTLYGQIAAAALGQTVWINHAPFQVIGVMQSYGQQLDKTAVMPLTTARRYIVGPGIGVGNALNQITVEAPNQAEVPAAMS